MNHEDFERHWKRVVTDLEKRLYQQTRILRVERERADGNLDLMQIIRVVTTPEGTIVRIS